MKIKISADSTCDLSPELIARYNIGITPLYIVRGDETLRDGIDVRPEELYAYAKATGKLCQTAAVNVSDYYAYFSAARAEYAAVIHFTSAASTSGTAQRQRRLRRQERSSCTNITPRQNMPCRTGLDFGIIQKEYSACRGEHCSPAERSGSRKVPGSMTSIDPYSVTACEPCSPLQIKKGQLL